MQKGHGGCDPVICVPRIPCQNSAPAHRGPAEPAWARGSWTSRTPDLWQEAQEEELPTATHHRRLVLAARLPPLAGRHLHREQLLCREPCPYLLGGVCRPLLLQQVSGSGPSVHDPCAIPQTIHLSTHRYLGLRPPTRPYTHHPLSTRHPSTHPPACPNHHPCVPTFRHLPV